MKHRQRLRLRSKPKEEPISRSPQSAPVSQQATTPTAIQPTRLTPQAILSLQRTHGNQFVQRFVEANRIQRTFDFEVGGVKVDLDNPEAVQEQILSFRQASKDSEADTLEHAREQRELETGQRTEPTLSLVDHGRRVGVGEKVTLRLQGRPDQYKINVKGTGAISIDKSTSEDQELSFFSAEPGASTIQVTSNEDNTPLEQLDLDVIAPDDQSYYKREYWHKVFTGQTMSLSMRMQQVLMPSDVSFENVEVAEGSADPQATGVFNDETIEPHPETVWQSISRKSDMNIGSGDTASTTEVKRPLPSAPNEQRAPVTGTFIWDIPVYWRIPSIIPENERMFKTIEISPMYWKDLEMYQPSPYHHLLMHVAHKEEMKLRQGVDTLYLEKSHGKIWVNRKGESGDESQD